MKKVWLIPAVVIGVLLITGSIYYYIFFMGNVKNTTLVFNIVPNASLQSVAEEDVPDFSEEESTLTQEQIDAIKAFDFINIYSSGW